MTYRVEWNNAECRYCLEYLDAITVTGHDTSLTVIINRILFMDNCFILNNTEIRI